MRTFTRVVSPITADADGIAVAQTEGAAGDLTLAAAAASLDPPRRVVITSSGDDTSITFTIYGTDRAGNSISEVVTGANAGAATSNMIFASVTRIATSGATDGDVEVGWTTESISSWITLGNFRGNYSWLWRSFIEEGATANYDVEATSQNMNRDGVVGEHPDDLITLLSAQTGNVSSANTVPYAAVRLKVNSSDGDVTARVIPSATV